MPKQAISLLGALLLTLLLATPLRAEEISRRLVDGLGRPLTGEYEVMLYAGDDIYKGDASKGPRYHFARGKDGRYRADVPLSETRDKSLQWIVSRDRTIVLHLSFRSSEGLRPHGELEIKQSIPAAVVPTLTSLQGDALKDRLLEILAARGMWGPDYTSGLFKINDHIVSALRSALDHPGVSDHVTDVLCLFSDPQDLRQIASRLLGKPEIHPRCAGALVSPSSPAEWELLKRAVMSQGEEAIDAALALAANGSGEALLILRSALGNAGTTPDERVRRAIRWIESHPSGLRSSPQLGKSIEAASGLVTKEWEGGKFSIQRITVDRRGEKALVECQDYHGPLAARGYEIVFHKVGGVWVLKGIWFTWIS